MDATISLNKLAAIFISLSILGYSLLLKKRTNSWVTPAILFSLFWFCLTFFPLTLMFTTPITAWGTLYIAFCVFLFGLPTFLTSHKKAPSINKSNKQRVPNIYNGKFLSATFFTMQTAVIICVVLNLSIQGISPVDFIHAPLASAKKYLELRYSGAIQYNIFSKTGVLLNYTGAAIGGLILSSRKEKLKILIFSFFPSVLYMVLYADKGTIFLCAAIFYTSIIVTRLNNHNTSLTDSRSNKNFLYFIILLSPILTFSFFARGIETTNTSETIDKLLYYISSYAFGHLYAFSDWLNFYIYGVASQHYAPVDTHTWGFSTFMAIFRFFGDTTVVPDGYYDEYFKYKHILQSNIYTIYRGLIQDFGIIGSGVYMLLSGTAFNFTYLSLLKTKKPVLSAALFICMGGYIYTSFIISIMVWNSIFGVFILLSIILAFDKLLLKTVNSSAEARLKVTQVPQERL